MHRRPRLIAGICLVAVVLALLGGAWWWHDRPVEVTVPAGGSDPACAEVTSRLPATVRDQPRRDTSPESDATAAWGKPAVIYRCGVTPPGPTTDECLAVNGVDWIAHPLADGTSFTTFGRDPAVQVLVPDAYAPEPLQLPPFSDAVTVIPQGEHRCT